MEGVIRPGATDEFFGGRQSDLIVLASGNVLYCGDSDPIVRLVSVAPSESGWMLTPISERTTLKSAGDSPSISAIAATSDGALILLGVSREELSEVVLLAAPKTDTGLTNLAAFKMDALVSDLEFPVTSLAFGVFQDRKCAFFGTEEGLVERVEISSKKRHQLFKDTLHGGVKCIATDPTQPDSVFVSFCSGTVAHIDANGRVLAKTTGFPNSTTPDGDERFSISVCPATPDFLAVGSQTLYRPRLAYFRGSADKSSFGRWSVDGRFLATIKNFGRKVEILEFDKTITDPHLPKLKLLATFAIGSESLAPIVSLAFHHDLQRGHSVLLMSKSGDKTAIVCWPGSEASLWPVQQVAPPEIVTTSTTQVAADVEMDTAPMQTSANNDAGAAPTAPEQRKSKKSAEDESDGETGEEQTAFQPGENGRYQQHGKFARKILFWSGAGCVIRGEQRLASDAGRAQTAVQYRDEEDVAAVVEVYVSQTSVKLRDVGNGWDVAAVGEGGFVLGASVKKSVDDTYEIEDGDMDEDEQGDEDEKTREDRRIKMKEKLSRMGCLSKISFRPFSGNKEWLAVLPLGESVVNVALLETTVAVATSTGDLRLYTLDGGVVCDFFALGGRPVTLAAHKNTLFVVTRGAGKLQYVLMTVNPLTGALDQEVSRGDLPLVAAVLTWAHIADDFVCYVSDSELNVYGLYPRAGTADLFKWSRVLHLSRDCRRDTEGYWPVSVLERRLCCVVTTAEFAMEPKAFHTDRLMPFALKLPLHFAHNVRLEPPNSEAQLLLARLHTNHLVNATTRGLALEGVDEREVRKATVAHDKLLASIFRQYAELGAVEKALGIAGGIFNPQSLNAMLKIAAALNLRSLEDKLEAKFNGRQLLAQSAPTAARTLPVSHNVESSSSTRELPADDGRDERQSSAAKMVNPFGKRKSDTHENDSGNSKMPRAL